MKSFRQFALLTEERDHINTIRNLLALAQRPGTEAEGVNAQAQAERLAAQHGVDLATLEPEPAPTPKPIPQSPLDPYIRLLRQFGWVRERRPSESIVFINPRKELNGTVIEIFPDGTWKQYQYSYPRYGGNGIRDLYHHLRFNNS